jgi:hypothetical protein
MTGAPCLNLKPKFSGLKFAVMRKATPTLARFIYHNGLKSFAGVGIQGRVETVGAALVSMQKGHKLSAGYLALRRFTCVVFSNRRMI